MKILITGGAGNIGKKVVNLARQDGNEVVVFDVVQADFGDLEDQKGITVIKGFITDPDAVASAVKGVEAVIHLAALMPHLCTDWERTMAVNVGGTKNVLEALVQEGRDVHFVLSSSVATYGDTTKDEPPIRTDHPQNALDLYAESKIEAEKAVLAAGIPYTILRISGVVMAAFYDPNPWQFKREQRVEFIRRKDAAAALYNSVTARESRNKIFNIAGGREWQMLGYQWAERHLSVLGIPVEEAVYADRPGWFDWYDTADSQAVLRYQNSTPDDFFEELAAVVEEFYNQ